MSEELKRKEPVLQPMRIVQVDGPQPQLGLPSSPDSTPTNPTGKKLVKSKKEIEAEQRTQAKPKPLKTSVEIANSNAEIISNLDRNAKIARNVEQAPEYDLDWVKSTGGELVLVAFLQTSVSYSGYISGEQSFSAQKIRGLTMSWTNEGLRCLIKSIHGTKSFLIPGANVKLMELAWDAK